MKSGIRNQKSGIRNLGSDINITLVVASEPVGMGTDDPHYFADLVLRRDNGIFPHGTDVFLQCVFVLF